MTESYPPVNPLFASASSSAPPSPTPSRRAVHERRKAWRIRQHGGGGVAGHRGSDRLWVGRSRHDRHVLGIVLDEFGTTRARRVEISRAPQRRRTTRRRHVDRDYRCATTTSPDDVRHDVFLRPGWLPVSPSAAAAERSPAPPNQEHRRLRRQPAPNCRKIPAPLGPHRFERTGPARRPSPLRRARRQHPSAGDRAADIDSRQDRVELDTLRHSQRHDDAGGLRRRREGRRDRREPSATVSRVECGAHRTSVHGQHRKHASTTQTVAAAIAAPAAPTAEVATPAIGLVGFLNGIVTNLLNPFLAPAP